MCEGLISGCAAINANEARYSATTATTASDSLFMFQLTNRAETPRHVNLGDSQTASKDSQLNHCRVLRETTYGFITPLPMSCASVSVCELGVMSVQMSCTFVRLPSI